jgi:hypothetical protein
MRTNKNTNSQTTVPKGYRLRPSTHRLIKQSQLTLDATQDKVITMAIKLFRKTMIISKTKINK